MRFSAVAGRAPSTWRHPQSAPILSKTRAIHRLRFAVVEVEHSTEPAPAYWRIMRSNSRVPVDHQSCRGPMISMPLRPGPSVYETSCYDRTTIAARIPRAIIQRPPLLSTSFENRRVTSNGSTGVTLQRFQSTSVSFNSLLHPRG